MVYCMAFDGLEREDGMKLIKRAFKMGGWGNLKAFPACLTVAPCKWEGVA